MNTITKNISKIQKIDPLPTFWSEAAVALKMLYVSDLINHTVIPEISHSVLKTDNGNYTGVLVIELLDKYESIDSSKHRRMSIPYCQAPANYINSAEVTEYLKMLISPKGKFIQAVKFVFRNLGVPKFGYYDIHNEFHVCKS